MSERGFNWTIGCLSVPMILLLFWLAKHVHISISWR